MGVTCDGVPHFDEASRGWLASNPRRTSNHWFDHVFIKTNRAAVGPVLQGGVACHRYQQRISENPGMARRLGKSIGIGMRFKIGYNLTSIAYISFRLHSGALGLAGLRERGQEQHRGPGSAKRLELGREQYPMRCRKLALCQRHCLRLVVKPRCALQTLHRRVGCSSPSPHTLA